MNLSTCVLKPMDKKAAEIICEWEYPAPYDVYNFKGKKNGYLFNKEIWGDQQFCLISGVDNAVIGQVACQCHDNNFWIGWSFAPELCGQGNGHQFIFRCVEEIRRVKSYHGSIYLRVAAWNDRAKRAYEKAGFVYVETILDEIAYSNKTENFWVMKQD